MVEAMTAMPTVQFAWRRTPPPFLIGGAEVSQQLLAEEFAAVGWNVLYLGCYEPPWKAPSDLPAMKKHLLERGIPYEEADGELRYAYNGVRCRAVVQDRLPTALNAMLRQHAPDLLITSQEGAADLAAQARRRGVRVAAWLHSVFVDQPRRPRWPTAPRYGRIAFRRVPRPRTRADQRDRFLSAFHAATPATASDR
ncbi:glycosyltransferase [Streptomyces sp. NPDC006668]|uniref:glycosyltransferase n=1 Tax=Streptomyces sp. NPDC006668 TaxID=3156903 RepID=UPI0034055A7C